MRYDYLIFNIRHFFYFKTRSSASTSYFQNCQMDSTDNCFHDVTTFPYMEKTLYTGPLLTAVPVT